MKRLLLILGLLWGVSGFGREVELLIVGDGGTGAYNYVVVYGTDFERAAYLKLGQSVVWDVPEATYTVDDYRYDAAGVFIDSVTGSTLVVGASERHVEFYVDGFGTLMFYETWYGKGVAASVWLCVAAGGVFAWLFFKPLEN